MRAIPGGWYGDVVNDEYAVLVPSRHVVVTQAGEIPCPPNDEPLWLTVAPGKFAGQAHNSARTLEYVHGSGWRDHPPACGTSPVIYDHAGNLHISDCSIGSQGWRYVAPNGSLVTGDQTYGPRHGVTEYTDLSDAQDGSLLIGQGHETGGVCVWIDGVLRLLHADACYAIRAKRTGDRVSLVFYEVAPDGLSAYLDALTLTELRALPAVVPTSGTIVPNPGTPSQPTPEPHHMSVPNEAAFVASFLGPRLKRYASLDETRANTFAAVNACAAELHTKDARWGVLEKTGGDRVRDRAADILLYDLGDGTAQVVDVVNDAEGSSGTPSPSWGVKDIRPVSQWKAPYPVESEPQPEPKPQPSVDLSAVLARLDVLERALAKLTAEMQRAVDRHDALDGRHEALAAQVNALSVKPAPVYRVKGQTSRAWGHAHDLNVTLEPER